MRVILAGIYGNAPGNYLSKNNHDLMKIIDRYIAKNIFQSMALVLVVLLALFTFFDFLEEINSIGRGRYEFRDAVLYILLTIPGMVNQLLPISSLLGCVIGLGMLASNSELIALRSAGVSLKRIVWSVLKVAILVISIGLLLGEWIAPVSDQYAVTMRSVAISNQISLEGKQGLWAKDGPEVVNVRDILPGGRLGEILIYRIDADHKLSNVLHAQSASYHDGNWYLEDVTSTLISDVGVASLHHHEQAWPTNLSPDLLNVVTVEPRTLSFPGLLQYIHYLEINGLSAEIYKQALWNKLSVPLITITMMLLGIPFVFGPLRNVGIGSRIFVGSLIGIGFQLINQMVGNLGLVFHINPIISSTVPVMFAFFLSLILLRRVR